MDAIRRSSQATTSSMPSPVRHEVERMATPGCTSRTAATAAVRLKSVCASRSTLLMMTRSARRNISGYFFGLS